MSRASLYRLAQWMAETLPPSACLRLAEGLADRQRRASPLDRDAVCGNLSSILGRPVTDRDPNVREVFRNFGRYLLEFVAAHRPGRFTPPFPCGEIGRQHRPRWCCSGSHGMVEVSEERAGFTPSIEGRDDVARFLRAHRGNLVLSAHVGNWEVGSIEIARLGFPFSVVALPHRDAGINRFFDRQRQRCGVGVIPLGPGAAHRSVQFLKDGGVLGIAGDREFGGNGIPVSFLGRQALLPRGPALLSLRAGVPAVPVFLIREGPRRFRFHTGPPIEPLRGHTHENVVRLTQTYATVIEQVIRRFPTQWLMFQPIPEAPGNTTEIAGVEAGTVPVSS